ncbi:hypothetical protein NDU88_007122 [Pleurodeles waltl]|uniref:Uncharacterized protein n=1 Tax=Pleurodeles waltl TaxID=8319 RepID=A0AAV7PNC9_PLEWA|nr:hypothetical protein NDU88_007122 [Pleurodeles waltl]
METDDPFGASHLGDQDLEKRDAEAGLAGSAEVEDVVMGLKKAGRTSGGVRVPTLGQDWDLQGQIHSAQSDPLPSGSAAGEPAGVSCTGGPHHVISQMYSTLLCNSQAPLQKLREKWEKT